MSDPGRGASLSRDRLAELVAAVDPEWALLAARPATHGTDAVSCVTVGTPGGERELVSKTRTVRDRPEFRTEPYLLDAIRRTTSLPVPVVVAVVDDRADLPESFLMEQLPGETVTDPVDEVDPGLIDRVAYDASRFAGELAGVGEFERFGEVHLAEHLADPDVGISGPGYELGVPGDAPTDWRERLAGTATYFLDSLAGDDRFGDLVPGIRRFLPGRYDYLEGDFRAELAHNDYHLWNLLVDPDTGETTAVLDFAGQYTVPAEYELAGVESHLCGWAPVGNPRRERVRERILAGFERTHGIAPGYDRRRGVYLAATALPSLHWFSAWKSELGASRGGGATAPTAVPAVAPGAIGLHAVDVSAA